MANKQKVVEKRRQRRKFHVRDRVRGDSQRPRLSVFRSHRHVACQLIDDAAGRTLVSVSSRDKEIRDSIRYGGNRDAAQAIGKVLAERALAAGIRQVRFDRGCYKYHGRVAALADGAREGGLEF